MNKSNPGYFLFTTLIVLVLLASATVAFASGSVINDGVIEWAGHGSDVLPCDSGGHWVLAPAFGIDSAVLTVNGSSYIMSQNGEGSWSADSSGPLDATLTASVAYTGIGDEQDSLQLSHCTQGDPTATPTEVPPTSTPTEPPPTATPTEVLPTATPTENPPTSTPTGTPVTPTSTPTDPTVTPTEPSPTTTPTQPPTSEPTPTETPKPPVPAEGDSDEAYPGTLLGTLTIDGRSFELYKGVNAEDGSLLLPSAVRGGALYNNGIWIHRAWNSGWLVVNIDSTIEVTLVDGTVFTYTVIDKFTQSYGSYPSTDKLYLASCYSDAYGNWVGVLVYTLQ